MDSASILPSGDSAAPVTGAPLLSKFSRAGGLGRPSGETVSRNRVTSGHAREIATPGDDDREVLAVRTAESLRPDDGSPGPRRHGYRDGARHVPVARGMLPR